MKKKISELTFDEENKECAKHMPLCVDNGVCPFHNKEDNCCMVVKSNKPKYLEVEVEVKEDE